MTIALPPCMQEDSTGCYWDATVQGNGEGHSFLTYEGHTVYIEVPPTMHISGAFVLPSAENYAGVPNFSWEFNENTTAQVTSTPETPDLPPTGTEVPWAGIIVALAAVALGMSIIILKNWRR